MSGLINREDAILIIQRYGIGMFDPEDSIEQAERSVIAKINDISPVDAVPVVHGKWIIVESDDGRSLLECSNCHEFTMFYDYYISGSKHCPECGAKMDEVSE